MRLGEEKKKKEDRRKRNHTAKNIMACPIPQGGHNNVHNTGTWHK